MNKQPAMAAARKRTVTGVPTLAPEERVPAAGFISSGNIFFEKKLGFVAPYEKKCIFVAHYKQHTGIKLLI